MAKAAPPPALGSRVVITNQDNVAGTVKFVGATQFAAGVWIGVALDDPKGKNDGVVKDERYFECPDKHGIFVRAGVCLLEEKFKSIAKEEAAAMDPKRQEVKKQLALACEEHDLEEISRMLDDADQLGLTYEDLEGAQRILASDVQQIMIMEINEVREAVDSLVSSVKTAETAVSESSKTAASRPSAKADAIVPQPWLNEVGKLIEKRMSEGCAKCATNAVDSVVATSPTLAELGEAAERLRKQRTGK
jgi:dynactin complex subunit